MQQLKRVTVLINEIANNKKVLNLFKTNALPLLNLAGIDVNIIKVYKVNLFIYLNLLYLGKKRRRNRKTWAFVRF